MLWIALGVISAILFKIKLGKNKDGSVILSGKLIACQAIILVGVMLSLVQLVLGITEYPTLSKELSHIKSLEKRIGDIRGAYYKYDTDGALVAGSIENMKQSTNLSLYIAELALKEAKYSGRLKEAKIYKEEFPLYFFGNGWAISNEIYKLEVIDG